MSYSVNQVKGEYSAKKFAWRQMRDCIAGSDTIKRSNELYLPMPSGMEQITNAPSQSVPRQSPFQNNGQFALGEMPWFHGNPAYRAYLQRARFPDITANALRGIMGFTTKQEPEYELTPSISYLETKVDNSGKTLEMAFTETVAEILQAGKNIIVADIGADNNFYLTQYKAESNTNWDYRIEDGEYIYTKFVLRELGGDETCSYYREYLLVEDDEIGVHVMVNKYRDDEIIPEESGVILLYRGKPFTRIPVYCIGSITNAPEPDVIPLLGVSDIAITIYQETADLRQAHFLTCNPTLFIFGISENEVPSVIGSSTVIGIRNPQGRAEYPATDTSALDHIKEYIKALNEEAVAYGAALLSNPVNKESGEALGIRNSARGSNMVHIINNVSKGFENILKLIAEIAGDNKDDVVFEGNIEFAEKNLTSQDITALVSAWTQGAITQDVLLDNLRDAGYIDADVTNDDIKNQIETEKPLTDPTMSDNIDPNLDPANQNAGDNANNSEKKGNEATFVAA